MYFPILYNTSKIIMLISKYHKPIKILSQFVSQMGINKTP